jgi:hypothetical protein
MLEFHFHGHEMRCCCWPLDCSFLELGVMVNSGMLRENLPSAKKTYEILTIKKRW